MGYLTPILFRNDSAGILDSEPEQVIEVIKDAMNNTREAKSYGIKFYKRPKWYQFWKKKTWRGADCNPIEALPTRHADQNSTIVFAGNTWIDLSHLIWSKWERKDKTYLEYVEKCVKSAQRDLTELKKIIKEKKAEK